MNIKGALLQLLINSFHKKSSPTLARSETIATRNKFAGGTELAESAEELHKPIIRKFKKRKEHSLFIYHIWGGRGEQNSRYAIDK